MFLNRPSVRPSVRRKNFNIGHNFLISQPIYFILGHNNPWDKTFQMTYSYVTMTLKMTLKMKVKFIKKFNIGHNFLISEWIYFILGHNNPWDKRFPVTNSYVTLTCNDLDIKGQIVKNCISGTFVIV